MRSTLGPLDAAGRVPAYQQTRISAFLISAHGAEARLLASALAMPVASYGFGAREIELHAQLSRELEVVSLLMRATWWQPDPMLMWLAGRWELAWLPQSAVDTRLAIDAAAFGYALHTAIRPAILLPENMSAADPFGAALKRIESEGSRLVQAQLRFLKSVQLTAERDAITAAVDRRHSQLRQLWTELLSSIGVTQAS